MTSILAPPAGSTTSALSRWYYLAAGFFIFQAAQTFNFIDGLIYGAAITKSTFVQSLNSLQVLVSIFLFWVGYSKSKKLTVGGTLLIAVVAFLFVSVLWSVDPETSLRRSCAYLVFVLGVIGISNILSCDEYMQMIRRLVLISAIASLVLLVFSPASALMPDGAMRGVFAHKNIFGQVMAAGVLASLHGMRVGGGHRWSWAAMILLFIGLALASRSVTSQLIIFAFCAAETFVMVSQRSVVAKIIIIIISIPVAGIFVLSPDVILNVLGKDSTLTGRTDLWEYVDISISQRPLLGWGFGAFWSPINPAADEISRNLGWTVPEAHNGWRELLLQVGGLGTSLFSIILIRNVWIAIRCLSTPAKDLGRSLLLCCGGILLVAVSEEVLVDPSQISVGMLYVMGLTGERTLRAIAQRQRFRPSTPPFRSAPAHRADL